MLEPGASVGRYRITGLIGAGAMGVVYQADDPELGRSVALKLVRPRGAHAANEPADTHVDDARERLVREAQAMARLSHPNVISVYDVGAVGNDVFVAMELVDGPSLAAWLRDRKRTVRDILDVFLQAGRGLAAAHEAGLVHRDFKPDNVLVGRDGRVRVVDFGLSRALDGEIGVEPGQSPAADALLGGLDLASRGSSAQGGSRSAERFTLLDELTVTGAIVGTPAFMAPEQFLGKATDARTDQFSFCIALHAALAGQRPFAGDSFDELARHVTAGRRRELPGGRVPRFVRRALGRGLRTAPDERYPSMDALLEDLGRDPRARRLVAIAALGGVTLLAAAVIAGRRDPGEALCRAAPERLAGVWDDARRAEVTKAFAASGALFADDALRGAAARLDEYAAAWTAQHRAACEATHVTGEQSTDLLDLRMDCLAARRHELAALTSVLARADRGVVERAVAAVAGLPGLEPCADTRSLADRVRPPRDAGARSWGDSLRAGVAGVHALRLAGRYKEAVALGSTLAPQAAALGYPPVEAAVLEALGDVQARAGDREGAVRTLGAAVRAGHAGRDPRAAAMAHIDLGMIVGVDLEQAERGLEHLATASALVEGAGGDAVLEARIAGGEGEVLVTAGRTDEGVVRLEQARELFAPLGRPLDSSIVLNDLGGAYRALGRFPEAHLAHATALAMRESALGPIHPLVASSIFNIGNVLYSQGRHDEARVYYDRALALRERVYGLDHPRIAETLVSLATNLDSLRRTDEALAALVRALAIQEKVRGPESADAARIHNTIGDVQRSLRRHEDALSSYRRALAIYEKAVDAGHPGIAVSSYNVGQALLDLGRGAEAVPLFERALAIDTALQGPDSAELAYDLTALGQARIALGDAAGALPPLERALALRIATPGNPRLRAETEFQLARALWESRKDRRRALDLARSAHDTLAAGAADSKEMAAVVEAWLKAKAP